MKTLRLLALVAFVLPVLAHAHPGHEGHELTWDFASGAAHPLFGWDHLLAMVAVGLWAARLSGRSRWLVPAAFVGMMLVGAILARNAANIPGVEQGIAASLLVLGLLIATAVKLPTSASMAVVGAFALFHGLAHGAEISAGTNGISYALGFVATTVVLHAVGFLSGIALKDRERVARFAGGAVALAGLAAFAF